MGTSLRLRCTGLESASSRLKLTVKRKPHWLLPISKGVTLGYRRVEGPAGTWNLRTRDKLTGKESIKVIGLANDREEEADGERVLTFDQAKKKAFNQVRPADDTLERASVTLNAALDGYAEDLTERDCNPYNARWVRGHIKRSAPTMLSRQVPSLTSKELADWRKSLIKAGMSRANWNRLKKALAAALNLACRERSHIWKAGLETMNDQRDVANVVLDDKEVKAVVAGAYAIDADFGLLIDTLAVTGNRASQVIRLRVEHLLLDPNQNQLLMPRSAKGGGRDRAKWRGKQIAVPISVSLALKLQAAAKGRRGSDRLLLRADGTPWPKGWLTARKNDVAAIFAAATGRDLGDDVEATCYSLRHSSITRRLLADPPVPIRLVATWHNTSVQQIEERYTAAIAKHYAKFASAHANAGMLETGGNVVELPHAKAS